MRLGLGCVGLGSGAHRRVADDVRLVRAAVDLGVTVFDTADAYGGGASEHVLGRALAGRRDEVVVATKAGFVFRPRSVPEQWARRRAKVIVDLARERRPRPSATLPTSGAYAHQDFSQLHLRAAVHASLRRLKTDRIDVFQLHGPREVVPDLLEQLSDLVAVGDVVRFGVGADTAASADGWVDVPGVSVLQVPFGILDPEAASTTLPSARRVGRELWARGVLGGGLLALAERAPSEADEHPKGERIRALRRIAADAGLDQYQLAFGFLRAHAEDLSTVLVGSTSEAHLRRNVELLAAAPLGDDLVGAVMAAAAATQNDS